MTKCADIYTKFENFETHLAYCYLLLQKRFSSHPRLASFWSHAAIDELHHCSILRFCREQERMTDVDIDREVIRRIEDVLDIVRDIATDPELSIDEAFYAAFLVESSEMDDFYEEMSSVLTEAQPLLLDNIQASLRSHHEAFAVAAEEFCCNKTFAEAFRSLSKCHRFCSSGL
jgi:hypothetical protein